MRAFADRDVLPIINDYWEKAQFPFELVPKLAELGVAGTTIEGHGCPAMSRLGAGVVARELARADGSVNTFFGVHSGLAMGTIDMLGSEEQRRKWLPAMAKLRDNRRLRAHRARARIGFGVTGDDRQARWWRVRPQRRQAVDRQRVDRRRNDHLGPGRRRGRGGLPGAQRALRDSTPGR